MARPRWHIGDLVRKLREQEDWTQDELALQAGVSVASIRRMEKGDLDQNRSTYTSVAKAFGLTLAVFYGLVPAAHEPRHGKLERRSGLDRRRDAG